MQCNECLYYEPYGCVIYQEPTSCTEYVIMEKDIKYTLTLTSEEAKEIIKAVELLMRLKLNQSFMFSDSVVSWDFDVNMQKANKLVEEALNELFKNRKPGTYKNDEWYRLYNIYQVIRYAIHEAEYPSSTGVDSYPPMRMTDVPLPKCEWSKGDGHKTSKHMRKT